MTDILKHFKKIRVFLSTDIISLKAGFYVMGMINRLYVTFLSTHTVFIKYMLVFYLIEDPLHLTHVSHVHIGRYASVRMLNVLRTNKITSPHKEYLLASSRL